MPHAVPGGNEKSANHLPRGIYSSEIFRKNKLVPLNLTTGHCFLAKTDSKRFVRNQFSGEIIILLYVLDRTTSNSL